MAFRPHNSENILQKAVGALGSGSLIGQAADVPLVDKPKVLFNTAQGVIGNLPQNVMENPQAFAMGGLPGVQAAAGAISGEDINNLGRSVLSRFGVGSGEQTDLFQRERGALANIGQITSRVLFQPTSAQGQAISTIGNIAAGSVPIAAPTGVARSVAGTGKMAARALDAVDPFGEMIEKSKIPAQMARKQRFIRNKFSSKLKPIEEKITRVTGRLGRAKRGLEQRKESLSLQQQIAKQSLKKQLQATNRKLDEELESIVFTGERDIRDKVQNIFKAGNKEFGKRLDELQSDMSTDDFIGILDETADELGFNLGSIETGEGVEKSVGLVGGSSDKIRKLRDTFANRFGEGGTSLNARQVNLQAKLIKDTLGKDEVAKTIFNQKFVDRISEGVDGLQDLRAEHAKLFEKAKQAKAFKGATQIRRAGGKGNPISPEEFEELSKAEKALGTNVFPRAKALAEKRLASDLGVDVAAIKRAGSKRIAQLEQQLEALGGEKKAILSRARKIAANVSENFRLKRAKLSEKQLQAVKNDAIIGVTLSLLGFNFIRNIIGRKF